MRKFPSRCVTTVLASALMLSGISSAGSAAVASEISTATAKASVGNETSAGWCRWWLAPVDHETLTDSIGALPPSCWW
ncbi:MAG: hypothetical protein WBG63_12555 [Phormidesmis sp.]